MRIDPRVKAISTFMDNSDEYMSIQEIADQLGISRQSVWKTWVRGLSKVLKQMEGKKLDDFI